MADYVIPDQAPYPRSVLTWDGVDFYVLRALTGGYLMLYGWDGANVRTLTTDAAGHLQIDVLSSALPAGSATSALQVANILVLQTIDNLVNALQTVATDSLRSTVISSVLPAGAATSANQTTMITALQLIDDLRNALVTVGADSLLSTVIASALPTGASTAGNQTTMITALQLIDDLRNALATVAADSLRATVISSVLPAGAATSANQATLISRFRDQGFTFLDTYRQTVFNPNAAAGTAVLQGSAVAANQVWVVTSLSAYNETTAITRVHLGVRVGGTQTHITHRVSPATWEPVEYSGWIPLETGDRIQADYVGCILNDNIDLHIHGFKMTRD